MFVSSYMSPWGDINARLNIVVYRDQSGEGYQQKVLVLRTARNYLRQRVEDRKVEQGIHSFVGISRNIIRIWQTRIKIGVVRNAVYYQQRNFSLASDSRHTRGDCRV